MTRVLVVVLLLCAAAISAVSCKPAPLVSDTSSIPIVIIKGLFDDPEKMEPLVLQITSAFPNRNFTVIDCWNTALSMAPLWLQIPCYQKALEAIPGPKHLISFSQVMRFFHFFFFHLMKIK